MHSGNSNDFADGMFRAYGLIEGTGQKLPKTKEFGITALKLVTRFCLRWSPERINASIEAGRVVGRMHIYDPGKSPPEE